MNLLEFPDLSEGIQECVFFQDFCHFLKELANRPFNLTGTGNLQLREIGLLAKGFKVDLFKHHNDEEGKPLFKIKSENELLVLSKMRLISKVGELTKVKGNKLHLTRRGQKFIQSNAPLLQYLDMVRIYFCDCNWGYIHPRGGDLNESLAELLQRNQYHIWRFLLQVAKQQPIRFGDFFGFLRENFPMKWHNYLNENIESMLPWGVQVSLLRDLSDFNIVKVNASQEAPEEETLIQLTPLGVSALAHAMSEY